MPLNDIKVKSAKQRDKAYKLTDEKGLYLLVTRKGGKCWRFNYRFAGKQKTLAIGTYPLISLKEARKQRDVARLQIADNVDPAQHKQMKKNKLKAANKNSFKAVALEWHERQAPTWKAATVRKRLWILEHKLFPQIGSLPIADITPPHILRVLRRIESKGEIETAKRSRQVAGQVFRYAVACGLADSDPTRDLRDQLLTKKTKHHAALITPREVGKLLVDIDNYQGTAVVCALLKISPLVFQRPGEVRQMEWRDLDLKAKLWEIPGDKIKMEEPHIVPLSKQAVVILKDIKQLTGRHSYVFPAQGKRNRPASDAAVTNALRKMGYTGEQMTAHGFRAMGRTMLDEVLEYPPHLIEQQISHKVRDPLGRAYNRTKHLEQRKEMMQRWADYLDQLRAEALGSNVVAGKF